MRMETKKMKMEKMKNQMQITKIDISKIVLNPKQPRKEFNKTKLKELAASIKEVGLINPIQVKQVGNKYHLICGERRLKAHKLIKLKKINAIIKEYNSKETEMVESLVENLHRDNLTFIENENFVKKIWDTKKYKTKADLGKSIGFSPSLVYGLLSAEKMRKKTGAANVISTRTIIDTSGLNLEEQKKVFKKIEKNELALKDVRDFSKTIKKSPGDVKEFLFKNIINMKQANSINYIFK